MDEIRRRIADRLKELDQSQSWLSVQIGKNRGYMKDYFDGSPYDLDYETKLQVAKLLNLHPREMGVSEIQPGTDRGRAGLSEDCEPYVPSEGGFLSRAPHIGYFRMKSRALDEHPLRILPGQLLAFNLNLVDPAEIETGRIVVVQLYDKRNLTIHHGTIIREFIKPNKLITNSSTENDMISLEGGSAPYEPVIKGTLLSVIGEVN